MRVLLRLLSLTLLDGNAAELKQNSNLLKSIVDDLRHLARLFQLLACVTEVTSNVVKYRSPRQRHLSSSFYVSQRLINCVCIVESRVSFRQFAPAPLQHTQSQICSRVL